MAVTDATQRRALLEELAVPSPSVSGRTGTLRLYGVASVILLVAGLGALGGWMALSTFDAPASAVGVTTTVIRAARPAQGGSVVLDATGYVVARRQAAVSSKITGKVAEVLIEEGMRVEEGQLLARLDDLIPRAEHDLAVARLQDARLGVRELVVMLAQARRELDRAQTLAERGHVSRAVLEQRAADEDALQARVVHARQAIKVAERNVALKQQVLADTEIRAPFTGIVTTKSAQPGEMISPVSAGGGFTRTGIGTIVDMQSLEVEVDVNESLINRVHKDQPVNVVLNAYTQLQFPAAVTAIIPAADRNRATIRIRIGFMERDARILPGMGVRVSFSDASQPVEPDARPELLIPANAIGTGVSGDFVYVVDGSIVTRRGVAVEAASGPFMRVLSGVSDGERIVVDLSDGLQARLSDGMSVTISQ